MNTLPVMTDLAITWKSMGRIDDAIKLQEEMLDKALRSEPADYRDFGDDLEMSKSWKSERVFQLPMVE